MLQSAKKCKRVQKDEVVEAILQLKRKNPRATNKEMAIQLRCHRNTISKYLNYIRRTYIKTPEEMTNLIDNRLEEEINDMHVRDLISLRNQLVPKEQHVIGEMTETQRVLHLHLWKPEPNAES